MNLTRFIAKPFAYQLWRRRQFGITVGDLVRPASQPRLDHRTHLLAAIDWLCRAQDVRNACSDRGGVSAGWNFEDGWLPSYPETTGYIVETFIAASRLLNRPDLEQRAQRMIDWLLSIQHPDGAFPGHHGEPGSHPVIFNTGQIMHGLVAGYAELGREECLEAAVRAGHWMTKVQDSDGCWRKFEHNGIAHVYNTRATWAMVRVALTAGDSVIRSAARRNLDWALGQARPSGWFATNSFTVKDDPVVHTIAYAIRGFLESGLLLEDERYLGVATRAAEAVAAVQRDDGWLAGSYADGWIPSASYCCVTGVAQMALCWIRLDQARHRPELRAAASRAIDYVKRTQRTSGPDPVVAGAVPGSVPIWGAYARFEFPNWAAKFFADALLMYEFNTAIPAQLTPGAARERQSASCPTYPS